jgi:hypothetical protein
MQSCIRHHSRFFPSWNQQRIKLLRTGWRNPAGKIKTTAAIKLVVRQPHPLGSRQGQIRRGAGHVPRDARENFQPGDAVFWAVNRVTP